jgi:hypothetical protein
MNPIIARLFADLDKAKADLAAHHAYMDTFRDHDPADFIRLRIVALDRITAMHHRRIAATTNRLIRFLPRHP